LRDANEKLAEKGVKVFGVSRDSVDAQKKFADDENLPFPLIADGDGKVVEAFGVPTIGNKGFASRQAYLFRDGKLVWRDLKASTSEQAADVLAVMDEAG
jgi:peroxiredoxin Q/BCP